MNLVVLIAFAAFWSGVLIQLTIMLRNKIDRRNFWMDILCISITIGIALIILLLALPYSDDAILGPAAASSLIFPFMLTYYFRKRLLPAVNEVVLAVWLVIFWYLTYRMIAINGFVRTADIDHNYWVIIFAIPTALSLIAILFERRLHWFLKALLYAWYVLVVLMVQFMLFMLYYFAHERQIDMLLDPYGPGGANYFALSPGTIFIIGMNLFYSLSLATILFGFIPLRRYTPIKESYYRAKRFAQLTSTKFSGNQYKLSLLIGLVAGTAGLLYLNHQVHFVSEFTLVSALLIFSTYLARLTAKPDIIKN